MNECQTYNAEELTHFIHSNFSKKVYSYSTWMSVLPEHIKVWYPQRPGGGIESCGNGFLMSEVAMWV